MDSNNEVYTVYVDDSGDEYYCPIDTLADESHISGKTLDDCVEVSTASRYSGNLNLRIE